MILKNVLIFILCMIFIYTGICQENDLTIFQDSLQNKTFEQLNTLTDKAFQNKKTTLLSIYRDYHLKKAKKEHNNLEIARAYYSFIGWENIEHDLKYSDSIIGITKNSQYKSYPTTGYLIKARLYYFNSDFNKALDNYIIANEWADIKQDKPLQIETTQGIAAIKNIWGLHEEALDIYKSNYADIINTPNYTNTVYDDYILLANDLSLSYIRNNKPDSALVIAEKAMKQAKLHKDDLGYYDLVKVHATANYYLKKYPQAIDSLLKFSSKYSDLVLSDSYYMIAKIHQYQNRKALTINYFEKIDSIHSIINDAFPELKEVYNELFKYAGEKGNREKQLYYINQLIAVDSILDLNYKNVNDKMRSDYDIPKFKKEKTALNRRLDIKKKQLLYIIVISAIVLIALIFYGYRRQRILKERLQKLLHTDVIEDFVVKPSVPENTSLGISEHIVDDILEKLKNFEKSQGYLSKEITLNSLAKEFNTNSSYLSSIINQVKQINFSSYLKDLRITNAINDIKLNKQYLKYSINGLADEFGFLTAESFSKAFRDKTGIKPSYFLDELRKGIK